MKLSSKTHELVKELIIISIRLKFMSISCRNNEYLECVSIE